MYPGLSPPSSFQGFGMMAPVTAAPHYPQASVKQPVVQAKSNPLDALFGKKASAPVCETSGAPSSVTQQKSTLPQVQTASQLPITQQQPTEAFQPPKQPQILPQ